MVIAQKIKLGIIFPHVVLYSRRNVIGLGLIRPKTAIAMQAYKLYLGNLRAQMRIARIIRINKEAIIIEYGRGKQKSNYNRKKNKTVWIEEVHQIMKE